MLGTLQWGPVLGLVVIKPDLDKSYRDAAREEGKFRQKITLTVWRKLKKIIIITGFYK